MARMPLSQTLGMGRGIVAAPLSRGSDAAPVTPLYRASSWPAGGFTMTELVVAMAIVAVLLAVAAPGMRDLVASQRVRTAANALFSDLSYARAEAIKRNAQVQVLQQGESWASGWNVAFGGNPMRVQPALNAVNYAGAADDRVIY